MTPIEENVDNEENSKTATVYINISTNRKGYIMKKFKIICAVIIPVIILAGYYLYYNFEWLVQTRERNQSMVTEIYSPKSLHYDILTGNYVKSRIKILFGANVNEISKVDENTPLEVACSSMTSHERLIKMLVDNGAKINLKNHEVLLMYLESWEKGDSKKTLDFLIKKGADINHGAYVIAVTKNDPSLVRYFLNHHVNVNQTDAEGKTPLMAAWYSDDYEMVGAIKDEEHHKIIDMLLKAGAKQDIKDKKGRTVKYYQRKYEKLFTNSKQ